MPEGPEVRREADAISRALTGKRITEVYFGPAQLKRFKRELTDQTVVKVTTRGKALLIFFENGQVLYSHNQLYGRWFVVPAVGPCGRGSGKAEYRPVIYRRFGLARCRLLRK